MTKDDPNALLDALNELLRKVLAGGLKNLTPGTVQKMATLMTDHGAHLRWLIDGPLVECQLVLAENPVQREPITVFFYTGSMPAVSSMVN